jgi:hypothetical protein
MNKLTLLAVILTAMPAWSAESATLAPKGERPDVRKIERELREFVDAQAAASPEVAELEREIADLKDQQRSFRNADSEIAAAKANLKAVREAFHHKYGREPEFASDEQIEAEESLREANLRLHRARDLKDMDPSYFEDAIAKRESRRQLMLDDFAADWLKRNEERYGKLKDILFPRSIAQVEGEGPSVVQSRSYAPKRSPSFMGEIKPEPELVAPVN